MIAAMRRLPCTLLAIGLLSGCGPATPTKSSGPKTAAEKQREEFEAQGGDEGGGSGKWGAWKYKGERDDCFYVLGAECFKTEEAACKAAACKDGLTCSTTGGGPVVVECK